MNNTSVTTSDYGDVAYFTAHSPNLDDAKAAVVKAAHEHVFQSGRTAEVELALAGKHGGAIVTGYQATVRFQ